MKDQEFAKMRKQVIAAATAITLGIATTATGTTAFARGGGGGSPAGGHVGGVPGGVIAGGTPSAGSRGPTLDVTRNGRLYSVPLSASSPNALFPSSVYSGSQAPPANSRQQSAPQTNNYYYYGSYSAPSQSGQGGTAYGGTYVSVGAASTKVAQTCADAGPMSDVPVDQLRQIVHATNDQETELDRLKAASLEAKKVIQAACLTGPSATPVDRLEAAEKQSEAITRAAQILRPPFEKFYASLSNDQKASLNDANPRPQTLQRSQDQTSENRTNFKVGTRVKLRSGGPMMAVVSVRNSEVTCVWFNYGGQAESGTFPAESLM
jgi:uncharacterized protein YodC (DUF2158 family)